MAQLEPLPCFLCDELPKVGSFLLMDGRTGWTCLCPSKCYETNCWLERDDAVREWNEWVESESVEWDELDE